MKYVIIILILITLCLIGCYNEQRSQNAIIINSMQDGNLFHCWYIYTIKLDGGTIKHGIRGYDHCDNFLDVGTKVKYDPSVNCVRFVSN